MRDALPLVGNPSSVHAEGRAARAVIERAREALAVALGGRPADWLFTSGGTEAVATAVRALERPSRRFVTTVAEHPALAEALDHVEAGGRDVVRRAFPSGEPPAQLDLREGDAACVAWVQPDTGVVIDVHAYAAEARNRKAVLFVDACQAPSRLPIDVAALGADLVAVSASKWGGPKGVGALYVSPSFDLEPIFRGGTQERGRRAGTENVVAIAGAGAAALAIPGRLARVHELSALRDRLLDRLRRHGARTTVDPERCVASCASVRFAGVSAARLVVALDLEGIACSSGPACSTGTGRPSRAMSAMFPTQPDVASEAVRFSVGIENTRDDLDHLDDALAKVLPRLVAHARTT